MRMTWLFVMAILVPATLSSSCPGECRCLWKSSKITVECTGVSATSIPSSIDPGTQVLNMSENHLSVMTSDMFARAKLLNLQKINVGHNNISEIHSRTFSDLLNLVDIDLSHNRLVSIPSQSFPHTLSLMILSLSHNPISVVKSEDFSHLRQLTKLDLSHCQIINIQGGALHNLPSLERLYLEGNRLRVLSDVVQLGTALHGISLHDNPWHCDCHLRQLRDWLVQTNVPRLYEPTCHSPHLLTGFKITTINVQEFACLPMVSPSSMFITVREGKNVSLVCRVKSDPMSEIVWSYNGLLIDSLHPRMRMVQQYEGSLGTRSELLITNITQAENGSFLCSAENKAGKSLANYSVQVDQYRGDTLVMEMKMEHFIAVSVCVITILILLMVIVTILLVKIARKHLDAEPSDTKTGVSNVYKPSSMPRSIQMGTGHVPVKRAAPDLLSGVSQSQSSSDGSLVSMETVVTPASSDLSDMRDIIKDLGDHTQPLIGGHHQPSWSVDNPYLHTSGSVQAPYLVYRQRMAVRPDEQYPILSYQYSHQSPYYNSSYLSQPLIPSISDGNSPMKETQHPDCFSPSKNFQEKYSNGKIPSMFGSDLRNENNSLKMHTSDETEVSANEELDKEIEGINHDMETVLQRMVSTCWSEGTKI